MLVFGIVTLLCVLLLAGTPVAFAMLLSGSLGLYLIGGANLVDTFLKTTPLSTVSSYELLTVPMFILMAEILVVSRLADDMFDAIQTWVARTRGGLATATALTGALFGAISGSSTASAATLSSTSLPAMVKRGYDPELACGVVAISGTLAMLIPPSIALIIYAVLADQSVAKLLMAGIVPGILVALTIIATIQLLIRIDPKAAPPGATYSLREKLAASRVAGPFIALFICVTGVIYIGIATPTEAAGLGAFGATVLAAMRGALTPKRFLGALTATARATAMIYIIIVSAHVFGYFLTLTGSTQGLMNFVGEAELPTWAVVTAIVVVYLVLGCFMDQLAILILTVPIMLPLVMSLGYDPIWFGVVVVLLAEVGMVTPPIGMNAFVVSRYAGLPTSVVFRGIWPHVVAHILIIVLMIVFPQIILWLPETM